MKCRKLNSLLVILQLTFAIALTGHAEESFSLPKGLMLNLDFSQTTNGLILSKALYPLHVPQGDLEIKLLLHEKMLNLSPQQGLSIPHNTLIQPDGNSKSIAIVRVGTRPDGSSGILLSQSDDDHGFAIFLTQGNINAAIRTTGAPPILLQQPLNTRAINTEKRMVLIELHIDTDKATLWLDRAPVASTPLPAPLNGNYMPVRIGCPSETQLHFLGDTTGIPTNGINGAISVLQLWRQ